VFRSPWDRLVSAFCEKVVRSDFDLLRGVGHRSDRVATLTFRTFVQQLCQLPAEDVDPHIRPQHFFLGNTQFDAIGRFESLDPFLRQIAARFGLPASWGTWNQTKRLRQRPDVGSKPLADWTVQQLRGLAAAPPYASFYDAQLASAVQSYYQVDARRFGYSIKLDEPEAGYRRAA